MTAIVGILSVYVCSRDLNGVIMSWTAFRQFKLLQLVSGKWLLVLIKSFFQWSDKAVWPTSILVSFQGFHSNYLRIIPILSESPPILGDPGAFFAQYFSARVDFPSRPRSSYYLPLGLWGWSPLGSKTVHIRQRAGKFFSKLMQTWRFASVSVRHISLAKILLNKKSLCTSRKASWLKGTKRCRKVISRAKYLSFSLSRNKK